MADTVRPRRGDLEAATSPHPFRPSGEYVGYGTDKERCDLCGLVQRGTYMHPSDEAQPDQPPTTSDDAGTVASPERTTGT